MNENAKPQVRRWNLQRFTLIWFRALAQNIATADPATIDARKTDARDFARFVRNAAIVEIIREGFEPGEVLTTDPCRVERELTELEVSAHPRTGRPRLELTGPCGLDQRLAAIEENLALVAGLVRDALHDGLKNTRPNHTARAGRPHDDGQTYRGAQKPARLAPARRIVVRMH